MPLSVRSDTFWYNQKKDVHKFVFPHVEAVDSDQSDVRVANRLYARLYSNRYEPGLENGNRGSYRNGFLCVTENLVKSVIDTSTSLVAKSRPKASVLTDNGDWELQTLSREIDRYLLDQFRKLCIWDKMALIYRDAAIFGTGFLKFYLYKGEICCERVLSDEIVVDESEVPLGGRPPQMHQVRPVSSEKLKKDYPKFVEQIERAAKNTKDRNYSVARQIDPGMIMVVESWGYGRHTMTISTATLVDEDYPEDFYPFVKFYYSHPLTGYYGQGLAEDLLDNQIRQNELNDFARKAFDLFAVPRVLLPTGSKLGKAQLTDEIGQVIPVQGAMPTFFTPQSLNAEFFKLHEKNVESAHSKAGIAQSAATPEPTPYLDSGVARRELTDYQRQRLNDQQSRYETAHIECAMQILHFSQQKAAGRKPVSQLKAANLFEQIDWAAYKKCAENLRFNVQASSSMNDTPAARKQTAIDFAQYGVPVRPDELRRLLNHPDLELSDKRATAALENIEWLIGKLMAGEYHPPMPLQDLSLGMERVTAAFLTVQTIEDNTGRKRAAMDAMSLWITEADNLIKQQAAMAAPTGQQAPMPQLAAVGDNTVHNAALAGLYT